MQKCNDNSITIIVDNAVTLSYKLCKVSSLVIHLHLHLYICSYNHYNNYYNNDYNYNNST